MSVWPDPTETDELLNSAKQGDAGAVNQLLDRHRRGLRRMLELRLDPALARRVDASDIVQDVLIVANRRLAEYLARPAMPFQLWLRQLARDRLIDAHRRHRVAQRRSLDREQPLTAGALGDRSSLDLATQLRDPELTPAAAAMRDELDRRFRVALETLDQQDREVVLMRHDEQFSNQEVAEALGLSAAAAGMRYLRAMRRLRTRLDRTSTAGDGP